MHEPYDDFEDEEDYYKKDNPQNQYEKFFSIDPTLWQKYGARFDEISDGLKHESENVWVIYPAYLNNKTKDVFFVGKNTQNSQIFKKYFVVDHLNIAYKAHIQQYSIHFLKQPHYYKGMFDILN